MASAIAMVGPNAVLQMADVLRERTCAATTGAVFAAAGLARYLEWPPQGMIDEAEAAALHHALLSALPRVGPALCAEAGTRTADYLLANRIPAFAQRLLRLLPPALAARLLVRAIARHAWTFAGSGAFSARFPGGPRLVLEIAHNPLALPGCPWHCAVFTRLFTRLVSPRVRVMHHDCCANGGKTCRFDIGWG